MNPFDAIPLPTLDEVIRGHAADRPDAVALRFGDRVWTYRALSDRADRIAARLVADRVAAGDRVAWIGRNSEAPVLLLLALVRAGAIFVPLNLRLAPAEIAHILADAGVRLGFVEEGFALPGIVTHPADVLRDDGWAPPAAPPAGLLPDDRATVMLMYTSGTTGAPKGVELSQRSLLGTHVMRARQRAAWDDWGPQDVALAPLPFGHVGGLGFVIRTLFFGGEALILPGFDAGRVLDAIETRGVSKVGLVPTMLKMVIDHPRSARVDYSRIGTILYGAAPITADLLQEAMAVFGCGFSQSYGMTETNSQVVALPPEDHDPAGTPRMRAAGVPLPGTELRILGARGEPLPPGETGEVAIRTIAIMNGYWNQPEATARVLDADGWYRTGDAGLIDADGYLFIKDRVKDMIVTGGENVYPAEVENALVAHPAVDQVAVIGVPDATWGEAVKAVVVPAAGATLDPGEVIEWARGRIAGYKVPKSIDVVAALPLNGTGKVQKQALRAPYWAGRG